MKLELDTAQLTADLVWLTTVAVRKRQDALAAKRHAGGGHIWLDPRVAPWFNPAEFTPAEQERLARLCLAGVLDVTPMGFYKPATGRKVHVTFRQESTK